MRDWACFQWGGVSLPERPPSGDGVRYLMKPLPLILRPDREILGRRL